MSRRRHQPKPGDLIKVKRSVYQHWALYLGDGYVVHLTSADEGIQCLSASSDPTLRKKAKVKKQLLKEVVGTDDWEVNNKYDRSRTPLPVKEIIERAESYIGREMTYNVLWENCEHFVTMLRYGEGVSDQATSGILEVMDFSREVITYVLVGVAALGLTSFGVSPVAAIVAATIGATAVTGFLKLFLGSSSRQSWNEKKSN
ncbi:PREDICTED: HRAS-like suppressor 3 [Lepidothrix coronata]|uniref:HRAS-like suppressor 3 n=1 Tax=Lepidothrix coronata TaxID=321398 RepID=A0A6J0GWC0_9PASS|nr:PREDICTED: HRAS-like suppressor 3 [Lepidothrix coronata]XP_017666141.1 PREDICTED: HRAS-like suppressor 3 [Lepidothrix coronata]